MKKEIKDRWVAALRSGEYKQGTGLLCQIDSAGSRRYCCLGVLCEIVKKDVGLTVEKFGAHIAYDKRTGLIPREVRLFVGLLTEDPCVVFGGTDHRLSELNDRYLLTFSEIARLIEEQL